jgi:hypothetical protein
MPSSSQPPKRSWRDDGSGGRGAATKREWQKEAGGSGGAPRFSKRIKIILAATSLLTVVGGVVVLLLWIRHIDPPRLVLIGAGNETELAVPHNVYGMRGLRDLRAWAEQKNSGTHALAPVEVELTTEGDPFGKALKGCTSEVVVIFVSAHGGGSSGQGAYLIPNNAGPKAPGGYPMDKAFAALEQLPKLTKKLLILDTTQVTADWHLGMLHNDFVHSLANDPRLKNIDNLLILCASDEGQRSWVSEEYGQTIFAHFVIEGLKGAADEGNLGQVTAQGLIKYVKEQVESWVRHNRDALQTPRVFGSESIATDMVLATVERSAYKEPDPAKLTKWSPPDGVLAAWKQRDDLAIAFPHPATYTPHLWRQYHDSLLRYEQLSRAGDATNAETMEQELGKLAGRIRQNQRIDKDALAATLATPAALSWSLPGKDEQKMRDEFTRFWDRKPEAEPKEFGDALKEWQASAGSDSNLKHLVRVRVDALLLDRACDSKATKADFERVCKILLKLDDELAPRRPAEAHFALMMNQFAAPDNRDWARLRGELVTRVHAEQAALGLQRTDETGAAGPVTPYSEQLLPWIRKDVEAADKARRLREDLLFASPRETARLGDKIEDADKQYAKIQERAHEVGEAIRLRDRVLADLLYYTRWLARSVRGEDEEKPCLDTWDAVHQLCRLLDEPKPDGVEALQEPIKKIRFKELADRFKTAYTEQLNDHSTTQANWHRLQELLAIPLIPAAERAKLLDEWARISFELNVGTKQAEKRSGVDKEQNARFAQSLAQRQGRFAVRFLGIDSPGAKELEQIITRPEGEWQRSLNRAGDQIAAALNKQSRDAYEDTDKGRKSPLAEAGPLLRTAALRVRFADGAAVAAWPTLDPVGENRSLQMYELMKWQAERTFADYWAAYPEDRRNPYYRTAAKLYVDAAKSLAGNDSPDLTDVQKEARLEDLTKLEAKLNAPDKFELRWRDGDSYRPSPAVLNVTDEDRVRRIFGVDCAGTTPDGFPVVWPVVGERLRMANPTELDRRALAKVPKTPDEERVEYDLVPERPPTPTFDKKKTTCKVQAFFRGRTTSVETAVTMHDLPEITSFAPQMPPAGRIAVLASKKDYDLFAAEKSELVIVVDYSGSMTSDNRGKDKPRITRALDALEKCLDQIPAGVKVTLLTFAQKEEGSNETVIRVQWRTAPWDPDKDEVKVKMAKLRGLRPYGYTPLVLATVRAQEYFTPGFEGAKTLVILTDGGDSSYDSDAAKHLNTPGKSMALCLQKYFPNKDVAINVVGFEIDQLDDEKEKRGLKEYTDAIKTINGEFLPVNDTAELAKNLRKQLVQLRFHIDEKGGQLPGNRPKPKEGFDVSPGDANPRPVGPLTPGLFNVVIQTNRLKRDALTQLVSVDPGESVVLRLTSTPDKKGFQLRRDTYADSTSVTQYNYPLHRTEVERRDIKGKSWVLAVLQNQPVNTADIRDGLRMAVSLEERDTNPVPKDVALGITRPRHVWFRAATPGKPNELVPGLRFYPLANYPAPCYRLEYTNWPVRTEPQIDVWWNDLPLPEGAIVVRPPDRPLTQLVEKSVVVRSGETERTPVVIESVTQERRPMKVRPDEKEAKEVDCLVVRLRYPVGSDPLFVQLPNGVNVGAEHRHFTAAGKYTGIFWNVSAATAQELRSLTIYSVGGVLKDAHHVGPLKLGMPDTNWVAPPPLVD